MKKLILMAAILAVCVAPAWSTMLAQIDFEGGGTGGVGIYASSPISNNYSWADNGPSAPGNECLYLYDISPAGLFYSAYTTHTLATPAPLQDVDISVDVKNSWSNARTFLNYTITFADDTTETGQMDHGYVNPLGSWVALTGSTTLTEQTKNVKKIMAHLYIYTYTVVGRNTAIDNITFEATVIPEPATMCILGLGSLLAIRRKR